MPDISSTQNERVKWVRSLQAKSRIRRKEKVFIVESQNLLDEALQAKASFREVFATNEYAEQNTEVVDALQRINTRLTTVTPDVLSAMSDTQSPQGILAVLDIYDPPLSDDNSFAVIIDGISDPGNMGTIMRTAVGADVPLMYITAGTVDIWNPKVVRSAAGAHFRLPVRYGSWDGIEGGLADHVIFLADSGGSGASFFDVDWLQPSALIVSEEAHGPSAEARKLAHAYVSIPMPGGIESLNVGIATGILLFERVRQMHQ